MSNGYFLADTNSLVYAYRAGGSKLLDTYLEAAEEQNRRFAITETVLEEIEDGPLKAELGQYLADRQIPVLPTPDTEQRLRAGALSPKSAGEVSMLEVAERESQSGRVTRIWSDDKYFDSDQIMRGRPDAHRTMSAELLDEAYDQKFIGAADHQKFRAGYDAQQVFIDSPRLSAFRYDFSSPEMEVHHANRIRSAHIDAGKALGVAGLALEVYDGAESMCTANRLRSEGNATAADSELIHFGARSVGGWTGAGIGMATGAVLGVESGPGLLVTGAIGGVAGVFVGDKIAEWNDNRGIYNQTLGADTWTFDPDKPADGWRRKAPIDYTDNGIDNARRDDVRASPATENQLNYQATSRSVELVLGGPPEQRSPFSLPVEAGDTPSTPLLNWERNPESGQWQREVYDAFVERGFTPHHTETADATRAAQLDRQAAQIVLENAENSPASIAARYEDTYIRNGWAAHGKMPDAVSDARTNIDKLKASDGDLYERQSNGRWVHDGMLDSTASGRLHDELEATRDVLQARLPPSREILPVPAMDADARLRDTVAGAYRNAGVDANAEQIAATAVAVRGTWDANGLDPATTALQARAQPDGQAAIASLRLETDGKTYVMAAVTTPEDIARTRTDMTTALEKDAPLLDNSAHRNHGMYATLLEVVHERDHALGRTPDEYSKQLAGALTERALSQGLSTIGAAKFSDDGKTVGMTDTPNLYAEWARTSAGNAAELADRPLAQSSEGAVKLTEQMAQARTLIAQTQTPPTQDDPNQDGPGPKGPKLS